MKDKAEQAKQIYNKAREVYKSRTMKKVLAKCLITYPNESDMLAYSVGEIEEPSDVKVYHKGRKYFVMEKNHDPKYYEVIVPKVYKDDIR